MKAPLRLYSIEGPGRALVNNDTGVYSGQCHTMYGIIPKAELLAQGLRDQLTEDEAREVAKKIRAANDRLGPDDYIRVVSWHDIQGEDL